MLRILDLNRKKTVLHIFDSSSTFLFWLFTSSNWKMHPETIIIVEINWTNKNRLKHSEDSPKKLEFNKNIHRIITKNPIEKKEFQMYSKMSLTFWSNRGTESTCVETLFHFSVHLDVPILVTNVLAFYKMLLDIDTMKWRISHTMNKLRMKYYRRALQWPHKHILAMCTDSMANCKMNK